MRNIFDQSTAKPVRQIADAFSHQFCCCYSKPFSEDGIRAERERLEKLAAELGFEVGITSRGYGWDVGCETEEQLDHFLLAAFKIKRPKLSLTYVEEFSTEQVSFMESWMDHIADRLSAEEIAYEIELKNNTAILSFESEDDFQRFLEIKNSEEFQRAVFLYQPLAPALQSKSYN